MPKTLIRGGHLVTASDDYLADVLVDGEHIAAIGQDLSVFDEDARQFVLRHLRFRWTVPYKVFGVGQRHVVHQSALDVLGARIPTA